MQIVLLGPPGVGKGTQADQLEKALGVPHVASGDLFRENLKQDTPLGREAREYMDRGELVPDDITIAMVRERLQASDCGQGVILDGFPRTVPQAEGLEDVLSELGWKLDGVFNITAPEEELVSRLSGRRICRNCQTPYHVRFNPPTHPGVCDVCGGELYQREDDKPETVRKRLQVYHEQTAPLIDYYRKAGLLHVIDGDQAIDAVTRDLMQAIEGLS
jgi:adenylate kinase